MSSADDIHTWMASAGSSKKRVVIVTAPGSSLLRAARYVAGSHPRFCW